MQDTRLFLHCLRHDDFWCDLHAANFGQGAARHREATGWTTGGCCRRAWFHFQISVKTGFCVGRSKNVHSAQIQS